MALWADFLNYRTVLSFFLFIEWVCLVWRSETMREEGEGGGWSGE